MGLINGTFRYRKSNTDVVRDETTGYLSQSGYSEWKDGCECQIDRAIPARQIISTDGEMHAYNYDVFIPKYFNDDLNVADEIEVVSEEGVSDTFTVQGVDPMNRRYIEIWG